MRTMHSASYGLAPWRAPLRLNVAAFWLGCAVLVAPASAINTPPVLIVAASQTVNEGEFLDLSGFGGAPALGFFADPDLADVHQTTVGWGDGTATQTPAIGSFPPYYTLGGSNFFADDGLYTVIVNVNDGAGGSDSESFNVTVNNVAPTLSVTPSPTSIVEGQSVSFNAAFSDPGFDNPLNPTVPPTGLALSESFRYYLNWGDGLGTIPSQGVADNNGGPAVPSTGSFSGSHTYNVAGAFGLTVRLADDNMGAYANSTLFVTGTAGVDYVEQAFAVSVAAVPEPASIMLSLIGLACVLTQRRRMMPR